MKCLWHSFLVILFILSRVDGHNDKMRRKKEKSEFAKFENFINLLLTYVCYQLLHRKSEEFLSRISSSSSSYRPLKAITLDKMIISGHYSSLWNAEPWLSSISAPSRQISMWRIIPNARSSDQISRFGRIATGNVQNIRIVHEVYGFFIPPISLRSR